MGGYGLYVWGSLGMCAAVLVLEVALIALRRRALVREALDPVGETRGAGV